MTKFRPLPAGVKSEAPKSEVSLPGLGSGPSSDKNLAELAQVNMLWKEIMSAEPQVATIQALNPHNELVLESIKDGIFIVDLRGKITFANRAATKALGWTSAEMLGRDAHDLLHYSEAGEASCRQHECLLNATLQNGSVHLLDNEVFWRKDGTSFKVQFLSSPVFQDGKVMGGVVTFHEIAEAHQVEEKVSYLAYYDPITHLPNRSLFVERLSRALTLAKVTDRMLGVLFLAVDHFQKLKDTLGSDLANLLLRGVAERLLGRFGETVSIASFGSGEFALLLPEAAWGAEIGDVVPKIELLFKSAFLVDGHELFVTTSIGISVYPFDGQDEESLLRNSGAALYRVREHGGSSYQFYTPAMNARALKRLDFESSLRRAVDRDQFLLHYQPKVEVATGRVVGMEALVRWRHAELGMVSPVEFIPLAEETGLIEPIGEWVLRTACRQNKTWQAAGLLNSRVAVNLSPRQFQQPGLIPMVDRILKETQLEAGCLELELTESSMMKNTEFAITTLAKLKEMGITLSIDDFGSGYSSLAYLKRFPIDYLKIDQSFVRDIVTEPKDAAIVTAIVTLAHSLELKVVAEGVETEEQLQLLRRLGCDEIQGDFISRPVTAESFPALVQQRNGRVLIPG